MKKKKNRKRESSLVSALDVLQTMLQKSKGSFSYEYKRMRLEQSWSQIVGEDLAKDTRPRKLYKTTLYVSSKSSEAMYHFKFSADVLLKRVNEFLGEAGAVTNFNFSPPKEQTEYTEGAKKFIDQAR